jgi:hypothetical protein
MVKLASPPPGGPASVLVEGGIPYAAVLEPALPDGIRIEDRYYEQYLEGGMRIGVYLMKVVFKGDPPPATRIASVEYRLPSDQIQTVSPPPRPQAYNDFYYDASINTSMKQEKVVVVVIRWRDGKRTTHRMPMRVP